MHFRTPFCPQLNKIKKSWAAISKGLLKRLPLKCHSFRARSNFPRIWFRDLKIILWGPEIKHLKTHNFLWQGCFFFHYYIATSTINWVQIFTGYFCLCICWDTPSEETSLWQLPIVSTAFKYNITFIITSSSLFSELSVEIKNSGIHPLHKLLFSFVKLISHLLSS